MLCWRVQKQISVYLDGELNTTEKKIVEEHLAGCPDCQKTLTQWKTMKEILTPVGQEKFPPPLFLETKVLNRLVQRKTVPNGLIDEFIGVAHKLIPLQVILAVLCFLILEIQVFSKGKLSEVLHNYFWQNNYQLMEWGLLADAETGETGEQQIEE